MSIKCPRCKSDRGFYTKEQVRGTATPRYTKDGHYARINEHLYDSLIHSGGKNAFCLKCDSYIGKSENLISGLTEEDVEANQ